MSTSNDMTDGYSQLEIAKALKAIRAVSSDEQFARIQEEFASGDEQDSVSAKISALTEEDEFAILCRMMGTVTHIIPLGQSPLVREQWLAADFLVRFQPGLWIDGRTSEDHDGFSCFVEVKSTSKLRVKVSKADLRRRRQFARTFGFPLLFAVRFTRFPGNAYWVVVDATHRPDATLTISVEELFSGLRHVLFDEYWYMLYPDTTFECAFRKSNDKATMQHPDYGGLSAFSIVSRGQVIRFEEDDASIWSAFFEAYRLEETGLRESGDQTFVSYKPGVEACSIIDLVYSFNTLPVDSQGNRSFDASRLIAKADLSDESLFVVERATIDSAASRLQKAGVLLLIGVNSENCHRSLWHQYGGRSKGYRLHRLLGRMRSMLAKLLSLTRRLKPSIPRE